MFINDVQKIDRPFILLEWTINTKKIHNNLEKIISKLVMLLLKVMKREFYA